MAKATKKKAKKRPSGDTPGRPSGTRPLVPYGVGKLAKILSGLPEGCLDIPEVKAALRVIQGVMDGSIAQRHCATRLQAATMMIEFYAGKPKQRNEHDVGPTLAEMLAAAGQRRS